ncbi:MAG TPA: TerC family protein [Terriglobales bacterium]|nr:TerC family protein [Terriglobales bacterium]
MEGPAFWIGFNVFVLAMIAMDFFLAQRKPHAIKFREAMWWTAFWVGLAAAFAVLVYIWRGPQKTLEFATGYLIEESLSVDNLFVFLVLFGYFKVPEQYQRKVLTLGILGALVMRGLFILAGVGLINRFHWIIYVFGVFLIYTGFTLLRKSDEDVEPEKNIVLRLARRWIPITSDYEGDRFFVKRDTRTFATPLFAVLLVVETTDVVFALDSIPAILAISKDPFIVYTSNVFAILGLRALYFALAGMMQVFHYLHYGLAVILMFIGVKMLLSARYEIPIFVALGVVILVLAISVGASVAFPAKVKA